MDIVFFGTPEIALPSLEKLHNRYNVRLIVCKIDKPKNRGHKYVYAPTKEFAIKHKIEVFQPKSLKNNIEAIEIIKTIKPDFLVVVAYGLIIPKTILNIPKKAPINVHFSLLPKYRGAAPVNWAIINGEKYTGVTTMLMNEKLDAGDILLQDYTTIDKKDAQQLNSELSIMGSNLLIKTLDNFNRIKPKKQNEERVNFAPMLKKEDGIINWSESAKRIECRIRGLIPWPTAYSFLNKKRIKFYKAHVKRDNHHENGFKVGQIMMITKDNIYIKTGKDILVVDELQLEGKKRMKAGEFIRGSQIKIGDIFK